MIGSQYFIHLLNFTKGAWQLTDTRIILVGEFIEINRAIAVFSFSLR